ncbi:MAG TPA: ATP-binding cassette domain-containing protein [Thermoleophilaceae bacterium]|nr:ATP-binding cassette domain-containing protein [Thermoleophilaceae bacterium]
MLRLDAVSKSFWRGSTEITALREVSLEVPAREVVAVYGPRSAGKTTLLEIAAGLSTPDRGKVEFHGTELSSLSRKQLAELHREEIAWVERGGPKIRDLPMHVYVGLPLYRKLTHQEARRRAVAALDQVGASDYADSHWRDLPDTARTLVALAHALVRRPRLLIVDDPAAGLGMIDRQHVVGLLRTLVEADDVGVLMASPDMPSMLHTHQVRALTRGRLLPPAGPQDGDRTVVPFRPSPRSA